MVEGWRKEKLGDNIVSLRTGLNPRCFFVLNTHDSYNYYVTIKEMVNGQIVFSEKTDKMNEHAIKLCNDRSNLDADDVLFSGTGTVGEIVYVDRKPKNWNIKEGIYAVKTIKSKLYGKYLAYYMRTNEFRRLFSNNLTGSTIKSIPMEKLKSFDVFFPSFLDEQRRIATALSDVDALITDLEKLIVKEKDIQKGMMQELLTGKRRLPGFSGEWEEIRLEDIFDRLKGNGLCKDVVGIHGNNKCILYGELFTRYGAVITKVIGRTDATEGLSSKIGDLLMPGSTTTEGKDLAISSVILEDNVLLGGDICVFRPKKQVDTRFISLLIPLCVSVILPFTHGVTIIHLKSNEMMKMVIKIPHSPKEQGEIVSYILNMESEIQCLENKLEKYRRIKEGMMHELLTGHIRLLEE